MNDEELMALIKESFESGQVVTKESVKAALRDAYNLGWKARQQKDMEICRSNSGASDPAHFIFTEIEESE